MRMPMRMLRAMGSVACLPLLLTACDDGGPAAGPHASAQNLHGTAAIGVPLAGAAIALSCRGGQAYTAIADAGGAWQVSVPADVLPCVVGATVADTAMSVFSVTQSDDPAQTVNVTTLTSLAVAHAIGAAPDPDWFAALDDDARAAVRERVPAAVAVLQQALTQRGYGTPAVFNPVSDALVAEPGNVHAELLESFALGIARNNVPWLAAANQFASDGLLPEPGFSIAEAGGRRASGTLRVSNPETTYTFAPRSAEFQVRTTVDGTVYTFRRSSAVRFYQGFGEYSEHLVVTVNVLGVVQKVVYDRQGDQDLAYLPVICDGAECAGIGLVRSGNQVEVRFDNLHWPDWLTRLDGRLVGYAEGAVWDPADLPGKTVGSLAIAGVDVVPVGATLRVETNPGERVIRLQMPLADGRYLVVDQAELLDASGGAQLARRQLVLWGAGIGQGGGVICDGVCGVMLALTDTAATWTFSDTPLSPDAAPEDISRVNGTVVVGRTYGEITGIAFTPETGAISAEAEGVRILVFHGKAGNAGAALSVVTRDGVLQSIGLLTAESLGPLMTRARKYECRKFAGRVNFVMIPACAGVTLSADGLEVTFDNTVLPESLGVAEEPLLISGTLYSDGA